MDNSGRENDSEQCDYAHENDRERCDFARESPRRLIALFGDALRERGDERSRESAFREKIAQHIWRAKRGQERVHVPARAEKRSENDFAQQPENTAAQNRDTNHAGSARAHSPVLRHSRQWNRRVAKAQTQGAAFGLAEGARKR